MNLIFKNILLFWYITGCSWNVGYATKNFNLKISWFDLPAIFSTWIASSATLAVSRWKQTRITYIQKRRYFAKNISKIPCLRLLNPPEIELSSLNLNCTPWGLTTSWIQDQMLRQKSNLKDWPTSAIKLSVFGFKTRDAMTKSLTSGSTTKGFMIVFLQFGIVFCL